MDPFGDTEERSSPSGVEEEQDPAAAFLAQERNQLAGLDDDDFEKFDNGFDAPQALHNNTVAEGHAGMTQVRDVYEDDHLQNGGDDFMVNGGGMENGYDGGSMNVTQQPTSVFEPPKIRPSTPEKIRKWREDQKERLEKKDADEEKKKQELRQQAQHELQEWYQLQDENNKKARKNNREAEKDFVQQRDSDKPGEEWERVARLCDFNPKSQKGTKDVSRLRSIILQLKQA